MTLSTALQSIYNTQTNKTQPEDETNLPAPDDLGQQSDSTDIPNSQDDLEMVDPLDAAGEDDQLNDTSDPATDLIKSLVAWMVDNSDTINAYLDSTEGSDSEDGEDFNFDDFGHSDDASDQEHGEDLGDNPQYKEFEELGKQTPPAEGDLPPEDGDIPGDGDQLGGMENPEGLDNPDNAEDPDRQGDIRAVPNAHLVYKRQVSDGTFEELWFYNSDKDAARSDEDIKKDILSGTDIDSTKISSEDGTQQYTIWSIGNGQMIQIIGLAN